MLEHEISHDNNYPVPLIEYGSIHRPEQRSATERALHTAGHELNHALVAIDRGIMPISLSVVPEGNSLGRTVFAGNIDNETFKVIAAGGAVSTPFGNASGFGSENHHGSDFHHIHKLTTLHGGIDATAALERAERAISRVPKEVRRKASEIIASMENITGDMIPHIIAIAEYEVNNGIGVASKTISESISEIKTGKAYAAAIASGEKTIIDIDENGVAHPVLISEEKDSCKNCKGVGAHRISCFFYQKEETREKKSKDMIPDIEYTLQNPTLPIASA